MSDRRIVIQQTLHGYANGHQMLAGSGKWNVADWKKLDELSDLNGIVSEKEFSDYYTGYPLCDGTQYVIAKTWYAYEMQRPGCVWTHSLIFDINDISKIKNVSQILNLFQRPNGAEFAYYQKPVYLECEEDACSEYNSHKLQYVIYTMLSSEQKKLVLLSDTGEEFTEEILLVLRTMEESLLKTFSFCTRSYSIRKYNGKPFEYQLYCPNYYDLNQMDGFKTYLDYASIKDFPFWVKCYEKMIEKGESDFLNSFIRMYGEEYFQLYYYNRLARIFFVKQYKSVTLSEYVASLKLVLPDECKPVIQKTMELILDEMMIFGWFSGEEIMILEMLDLGLYLLSEPYRKKLSKKILSNNLDDLYPILKKYISGELKSEEKKVVESIIVQLTPSKLKLVSHMEEHICMVLVHWNGNLLLSGDIWKQTREFQLSMLDSCADWEDLKFAKKLLRLIMKADKENISENLYLKIGNKMISLLYELLYELGDLSRAEEEKWVSILVKDQKQMFSNFLKMKSSFLRRELFLHLNLKSSQEINGVQKEEWIKLFRELMDENKGDMLEYSIQFLFVILCSEEKFEDATVKEMIEVLYRKLEKNALKYEYWSKIQCLLPEVEPCYAWDKCLRVRRALEEKGYYINWRNGDCVE